MHIKTRIILRHSSGSYLNRRADGHTKDIDAAIRFTDMSDASEWLLNAHMAPQNTDDYEYVTIEIITRVKEEANNEREHADLRKG